MAKTKCETIELAAGDSFEIGDTTVSVTKCTNHRQGDAPPVPKVTLTLTTPCDDEDSEDEVDQANESESTETGTEPEAA